ncbi:uncharacterized protein (TIGR01655 family) [Weissella uvarum]|uniref:YxeA family protein n=1 Tax=Weissella uvarum TaxID=1479233 RepID=UPI00195F5217|nr:YxeA family protein [Weissella uvarum]MBM7617597.1 uncharacterized protein (TIGR01655 family) [Weissella uvarum]MCM0595948.1 YxeA family protein [Weissella uvarum]
MNFDEMIKAIRLNREMTQEEFAQELNITRQTLSRWETGRGYPNLDTLVDLSYRFDISLDELLKGKDLNGEKTDVVETISKDVRDKQKYKILAFVMAIIMIIFVIGLSVLGYGREKQVSVIDRFNPFLQTSVGYGRLPKEFESGKVDTFIMQDAFGEGEWLNFITGKEESNDDFVMVKHKGAYVMGTRTINKKNIPVDLRSQMPSEYMKYNSKADGPRVAKKVPWWPFD